MKIIQLNRNPVYPKAIVLPINYNHRAESEMIAVQNNKERDRKKKNKSKIHRLGHETPTGRRLLARKYRRTQKQKAVVEDEETLSPTGKDYKTGGWITR